MHMSLRRGRERERGVECERLSVPYINICRALDFQEGGKRSLAPLTVWYGHAISPDRNTPNSAKCHIRRLCERDTQKAHTRDKIKQLLRTNVD